MIDETETLPTLVVTTENRSAYDAALHLYEHSSLYDVVVLDPFGPGRVTYIPVRPVQILSSGEQVLWGALNMLAAGEIPIEGDLERMTYAVDTLNGDALKGAVEIAEQGSGE